MIRNMANAYGIPRHIDPADGLIEEYWRTAGIVAGLERKVASIPMADITWGVTEIAIDAEPDNVPEVPADNGGKHVKSVKQRASINVWVKLFNEERDRYAKLGVEIVRLGLEARRDEYVRAQVEVFASVLLSPDLALSQEQRETAARLLRGLGQVRVITGQVVE
jgi:hypothetical protein